MSYVGKLAIIVNFGEIYYDRSDICLVVEKFYVNVHLLKTNLLYSVFALQ